MAFTASTQWDIQTGGDDSANGGGFDPGVTGFASDGAATSANTSSPVFTSASYTFVAGDVGAWLFIKSGTNWTPGFYKIASVSAGAATLSAAAGAATLYFTGTGLSSANPLSLVAGCATTASPTASAWGIDYSQGASAQITFTDLVIGGTTTQFTSAGNPVGKNFIGNVISVTSGTGFTVQRVVVSSTSGTTATCDKTLGTGASTAGHGGLGGPLLTPAQAMLLIVSSNIIHIKDGTYSTTTAIAGNGINWTMRGYGTFHGDGGTRPLITTATNSIHLFDIGNGTQTFDNVNFSTTAGTPGRGLVAFAGNGTLYATNCKLSGFTYGIDGENATWFAYTGGVFLLNVEIASCTTYGVINQSPIFAWDCYLHGTTGPAIFMSSTGSASVTEVLNCILAGNTYGIESTTSGPGPIRAFNNTIANNTSHGIYNPSQNPSQCMFVNNIIYGNGGFGINMGGAAGQNQSLFNKTNAFGSNTSGDVNNWVKSPVDLAITADPFTSSGSGDYSLNSTAGGGALLKGAGSPGAFPAGTSTGNEDIGAVKSAGSGGGAGTINYGFIG